MNDQTHIPQSRAGQPTPAGHADTAEREPRYARMMIVKDMKRLASGWSKSMKIRCTVSGRRILWSN